MTKHTVCEYIKRILIPTLVILFVIIIAAGVIKTGAKATYFGAVYDLTEKADIQMDNNGTVILTFSDLDARENNCITFYTQDSYVQSYLYGENGSKLIYQYGQPESISSSPGSKWHFIHLPQEKIACVKVCIHAAYGLKETANITVYAGSAGSIAMYLIKKEALDVVLVGIIFVIGLFLCLIALLEKINTGKMSGNVYLGITCVLFTLWSLCPLFVGQLLFPYFVAQYFIYYFSLYLIPYFIMRYVESFTNSNFDSQYIIHCYTVVALTICQFLGILGFAESFGIFIFVSVMELFSVALALIKRQKEKAFNRMSLIAFVILIGAIALNGILYFVDVSVVTKTTIINFGLVFYLTCTLYTSLKNLVREFTNAKEATILREFAYIDPLTKLANRRSFLEKIDTITNLEDLCIVYFDVNNLKYYNDTQAHDTGDRLLVETAKILTLVYDKVYRTGGDEFAAVCINSSPYVQKQLKEKLGLACKSFDTDLIIEIACGYSFYEDGDISYEDIAKRADEEMYKHKAELKKQSKIKSIR